MRRLLLPLGMMLCLAGAASADTPELRTLAVREGTTAPLQDPALAFRLLKIRGYSVDVRMAGERRTLKLGQSFAPPDVGCTLIFRKISPETRIARFATNCK